MAGAAALSGSGASSLNGDELATISAASRSLAGLWELARHIDGHFLPYYLFMHLWTQFGTAELWLRLPSALAIGVAAGFLADLGRRLHSGRAGVTAAALFAVLPSVSYYGAFARPYAFAAAAVVFSFWSLHRLTGATTRRGWVLYGVSVALVCSTHLFAVLTLPAHLPVLVSALRRRELLTRALPAMAAGCVPALVLGLVGYGERHAVSWIQERGPEVLLKFPKMAAGAETAGVVVFAVALAGVALMWRRGRVGDRAHAHPWEPREPRERAWPAALGAWLVGPPLLLLTVSLLVTPLYVDRYLFVTSPALALLAGLAVAAVRPPVAAVTAGCLLVAVAAVAGLDRHTELRAFNGRFEDFPGAVRRVTAREGDAIVFGQSSVRAGFDYYAPPGLADDPLRLSPAPEAGGFGFPERTDVAEALRDRRRVWVVWRGSRAAGEKLPRVKAVREAGFKPVSSWHSAELPGLTVALFTRSGSGATRR
ncbi:glycosyltransferase family 39 protein [Nonomuraea sp. NPDC050691]|uniref:glycosyltransferase family 39 protein n=1 Tax=Nonomuraea sp. NPDC050691 TaxID=3155661 RepID=UPI0033CD47DE